MNNDKQCRPAPDEPSDSAGVSITDWPNTRAMDEFESALIAAYEQALENGVSPHSALAVMLDLASVETQRLG